MKNTYRLPYIELTPEMRRSIKNLFDNMRIERENPYHLHLRNSEEEVKVTWYPEQYKQYIIEVNNEDINNERRLMSDIEEIIGLS